MRMDDTRRNVLSRRLLDCRLFMTVTTVGEEFSEEILLVIIRSDFRSFDLLVDDEGTFIGKLVLRLLDAT